MDGPALDRHVALIGFMGAGKTTAGADVAARIGRPFVDLDDEIERRVGPIPEFFARHGEAAFRELEATALEPVVEREERAVISVGAGAVATPAVRRMLARHARSVLLDVDADTAWRRVGRSERPLARDRDEFRRLFEARRAIYADVADAVARDVDDVVLGAGAVRVEVGAFAQLDELVPVDRPAALVADAHVAGIYGADAQLALGSRLASVHELPAGEAAKTPATAERLWRDLRLGRSDVVVALGGGSVTDVAGFAAATYLRGVQWVAVPTTLTAQVDAAIGGKTGVDLPHGKNLVGAFHWPAATVVDPALLATLPEPERRSGMAEVVKTGLLAGERLWELPEPELVRRCAAFKTAVCLRDPHERGERAILNLGHTFAHALETASGYAIPHGDAVALGLLAALRLSGLPTDDVEDVLEPRPVRADRDRAREALARDKKGGRLVLLEAPGRPVVRDDVPIDEVYAQLDALIGR